MDVSAQIITRLPAEKQAKFRTLQDNAIALHAAIPTDRISAAYERREAIRAERYRISEHVAREGRRPDEAERLNAIEAREAEATDEIKRLEGLQNRASQAWNDFSNILARCTDYLRSASAPAKAARVAAVKLDRGQSYTDAVAATRAAIENLDAEREAVQLAPVPASELVGSTIAALDQMAAKGIPDFDPRVRGRDPLKLDRHLEHPSIGVAFLMFLFRDEIAGRLTKMVGADRPGTLTDAEQAKRLTKLAADRLDLERREEALIVAAEDTGQRIERRLDADPRAILEIE